MDLPLPTCWSGSGGGETPVQPLKVTLFTFERVFSESRFPLFRIMLYDSYAAPLTAAAGARFMARNLPACGPIPLV
jgi:hypothetical protein